jgi:iron complex transport system ATP-binding protein
LINIIKIELFLGKEKPALQVNQLELNNGLWALVGRNGAGKSTFLNAICGFNEHYTGTINLNHKNLSDFPKTELSKQISVVLSKSEVFGHLTGLDVLFLGRLPYQNLIGKTTEKDIEIVNGVIDQLNLSAVVKKPFSVLSDGEKQLIMIGRALVQDTPIIILDEPTAFLDVVNRKKIVSILHQISKMQGKLIIFSTHNIDLINEFCDGVLMINNNQLLKIDDKQSFKHALDKLFNNL